MMHDDDKDPEILSDFFIEQVNGWILGKEIWYKARLDFHGKRVIFAEDVDNDPLPTSN